MRILRGPWGERLAFLLAAALLFLGVFAWQPAIYGNDGAAIQRYVQRDRSWGGRVQVLAVEDQGRERFAVFRLEGDRSGDRWITHFRQNAHGDYAAYHDDIRPMTEAEGGIWTASSGVMEPDGGQFFAVWCEEPRMAELRVRFGPRPAQRVPIRETPQLVILRGGENHVTEYTFHTADGGEL